MLFVARSSLLRAALSRFTPRKFVAASFHIQMASLPALDERGSTASLYALHVASRGMSSASSASSAVAAPASGAAGAPTSGGAGGAAKPVKADKASKVKVDGVAAAKGGAGAATKASPAEAPAKKKYVPPPAADVPRRRRAPLVRLAAAVSGAVTRVAVRADADVPPCQPASAPAALDVRLTCRLARSFPCLDRRIFSSRLRCHM